MVGFLNQAFQGFPKGYDAYGHMSKIKFLVDNFPNVDWNYEWYAGQYFSEGSFPPLFHYAAGVLVGFGLPIGDAIIVLAAFAFVVIGCALYGLVRVATDSRVAGLIAALILLSSNAFWAYVLVGGLYPRILGMAFFSLFAFFAVVHQTRPSRPAFAAMVLSLAAAMSTHLLLGAIGVAFAVGLIAVMPLPPAQKSARAATLLVTTGLLAAFFYLPYAVTLSTPAPVPTFTREYGQVDLKSLFAGVESLPLLLFPLLAVGIAGAYSLRRRFPSTPAARLMILAGLAGAACAVYALAGLAGTHVFIYNFQPGQATYFAAWFFAALAGLSLWWVSRRRWLAEALIAALLAQLVLTTPGLSGGVINGDNADKRPLVGALALDPNERQYRVGVSWDGGSDWINSRSGVPQTRGYQQQGVLRGDWQYWLERAVWSADSNYAEANFLLDWYAVRSLYAGPDPDVVRRFEARPDLYRLLSAGSPAFARTFEYPAATPVLSASDARTALVIGDATAYSLVLRSIALADFDSRALIPIRGGEYLDSHSLAELSRFDEVILYQYRVHDRAKGLALLDRYVEGGGSAFIEASGSDLDQAGAASTPIPGAEIKRTAIGPDWGLARTSSPIAAGLDLTAFSPAVYSGGPWGISYIPEGSIASWATPVLLSNGYPVLVAGTLGRGRVVWSGMNLPYHASSTRNSQESLLLAQAIAWAAPDGGAAAPYRATFVNPQARSIRLEGPAKGVLFKENWVPNWRATVDGRQVEIYRAGPDFMYVPLGGFSHPAVVELTFTRTALEWIGDAISLLTLAGLMLYLVGASGRRLRRRRARVEAVRAQD
ncbi:MAG: hypothetical protein AUG05_02190 [Actinobacteria bacterium 13_1_20CM_2_66_18]|nr:MAG: hypothetical protein AUG05_02190 [Actinobacteria bacterium 13_1_20CM_2_66_18]